MFCTKKSVREKEKKLHAPLHSLNVQMPTVILQVTEIMNPTLEIKNFSIRICHINHWLYFIMICKRAGENV